jgi:hypothetical protein
LKFSKKKFGSFTSFWSFFRILIDQLAPLMASMNFSCKTTLGHALKGAIGVLAVVSGVFRRRFGENGVKFIKTPLHRFRRFDSQHAPLRPFPDQFRQQKQNAVASGANFAHKM